MQRENELERLLEEAELTSNDEARVAILERAVREAEHLGDLEAAWEARWNLMEAAVFSGQGEKALVAFSWCLAQCDKGTTSHSEMELFWPYKWIISGLPSFPQASKTRIFDAWEDMARRFERHGVGERVTWMLRAELLADMGELAASEEPFERWVRTKRDFLSDCPLCDEHGVSVHRLRLGQRNESLQGFRRIMRRNDFCRRVPQATYGYVLRPLLEEGKGDEAVTWHRVGIRALETSADCLDTAAQHIRFKVLAQDVDGATKLAERYWRYAEESRELDNVFEFYLALRALVRDVGERLGEARMALRPPQAVALEPCRGAHDANAKDFEVTEVAAWLDAKLTELAGRFDARNGNDAFTRRLAEDVELDALSRPLRLTTEPKGGGS